MGLEVRRSCGDRGRIMGLAYVQKNGTTWHFLWWGFLDSVKDADDPEGPKFYRLRPMRIDKIVWPTRAEENPLLAVFHSWVIGPLEIRRLVTPRERK